VQVQSQLSSAARCPPASGSQATQATNSITHPQQRQRAASLWDITVLHLLWVMLSTDHPKSPEVPLPIRRSGCAVLHGAPSYRTKKLQRVQNNAARIVLEAPRPAFFLLTVLPFCFELLACILSCHNKWILINWLIHWLIEIPRQPVAEDITLAAHSAEHRLQSDSADVQSPQHFDAVIPPLTNPGSITQPQPAIGQYGFHDGEFCEARLQMLCCGYLKLTTENCLNCV